MGLFPAPPQCYFTDYPTTDMSGSHDAVDYFIEINGKRIGFNLKSNEDWNSSKLIRENKHILFGDIFNFKWKPKNKNLTLGDVEQMILESDAPRTPKQRLDNLFLAICKLQKNDGEEVPMYKLLQQQSFYGSLYFKNSEECNFYLRALAEDNLIKATLGSTDDVFSFMITFKGLNYQVELTETGINTNNCFIAMSFSDNMNDIRSAIKTAVIETGFMPILIDELHIDADKTINDEIIASLKKSKFCVSDFSEQKDGVYFEAGYALGRGLKVIYTCHGDWFKETHFDTNHFPHIIYKTPTDLMEKLKMKIEAWVK